MKKITLMIWVLFSAFTCFGQDWVNGDALVDGKGFYWRMEPLLGQDENIDGQIDIANLPITVQKKLFSVHIGVSAIVLEDLGFDPTNIDLAVYLRDEKELYRALSHGTEVYFDALPAKNLSGSLVLLKGVKSVTFSIEIHPRQIIIASIGDSYSSGEGVPEKKYSSFNPSIWADGGTGSNASLDHARAHRSILAWPAQTALYLEEKDPHSVVSFVFLAASGAEIDEGLIAPFKGIDKTLGGEMIPQVDQLAQITGGKAIDYLFMGVGGNDIGIVRAATFCVLYIGSTQKTPRKKHLENLHALAKCVKTGYWDCPGAALFGYTKRRALAGLNGLPARYDALANEIKAKLKVKKTLLVGYPLPVISGDIALDDMFPGLLVDKLESALLIDKILEPLNSAMYNAAQRNNWQFIHVNDGENGYNFKNHTYSNPEPYPANGYKGNPGNYPLEWKDFYENNLNEPVRWFRTATEAVVMQGANLDMQKPWVLSTKGTLHPNEICHQAIMHQVLRQIKLPKWYPSQFQEAYQLYR